MSFFAFSRCAGSARRFRSASRPPSRIHGGRHASRPLEPAVQGYWFAATSMPSARACARRASRAGIRPQLRLYAVLRCQIWVRMPASLAIRKTSSSEASMALASDRWCVK